jgi:hypothetical protein
VAGVAGLLAITHSRLAGVGHALLRRRSRR